MQTPVIDDLKYLGNFGRHSRLNVFLHFIAPFISRHIVNNYEKRLKVDVINRCIEARCIVKDGHQNMKNEETVFTA